MLGGLASRGRCTRCGVAERQLQVGGVQGSAAVAQQVKGRQLVVRDFLSDSLLSLQPRGQLSRCVVHLDSTGLLSHASNVVLLTLLTDSFHKQHSTMAFKCNTKTMTY